MPRPRNVERKVPMTFWLPSDLKVRMDLRLWDPTMGQIPHGAHSSFLSALILRELNHLDQLEPQANVLT